MKTTVDLPDELLREVKVRAARADRSLKDLMTELLRRGLAATDAGPDEVVTRVEVPLVVCARPAGEDEEVTPDRVAAILAAQDHEALTP